MCCNKWGYLSAKKFNFYIPLLSILYLNEEKKKNLLKKELRVKNYIKVSKNVKNFYYYCLLRLLRLPYKGPPFTLLNGFLGE